MTWYKSPSWFKSTRYTQLPLDFGTRICVGIIHLCQGPIDMLHLFCPLSLPLIKFINPHFWPSNFVHPSSPPAASCPDFGNCSRLPQHHFLLPPPPRRPYLAQGPFTLFPFLQRNCPLFESYAKISLPISLELMTLRILWHLPLAVIVSNFCEEIKFPKYASSRVDIYGTVSCSAGTCLGKN